MSTETPAPPPASPPGDGPTSPPPPQRRPPQRHPPQRRPAKKGGTRLLLWVAAIGLVVMLAAVVGVAILMQDGGDPLADNSGRWLYVTLEGATDSPVTGGILDDPSDLPPLSTELTQLIRDAADDDEIPGIVLAVEGSSVGWAQVQEVRSALLDFKASGKPCVAWAEAYGNREYYLASACGEIQVAPAGLVLPNGLSLTQTYYAEAFEKLDVHPNFEHVGNFKSAVEPYERTGPSEFASEATSMLLDGIYDQLVDGIAQGRGVSREQALAWIQAPPMTAEAALDMGMVDRLSFRDELLDQVELGDEAAASADDDAEPDRKPLRHYRDYLKDRRRAWRHVDTDVQVAVIYAEGQIVTGDSSTDMFGSQSIGDRTVRKQLEQVREDDDVDAVVLRVNSPGGSGQASDAIWREVVLTADEKPLVVSMSDYAASGGYYISMASDWIVAEPGTLTGSIGVFGGKMNFSGALGKLGLTQHTWKRGERATLFSAAHDFDDDDRALFRRYLESFYQTFVSKAADGRGMSFDAVHEVAQGRVWTGQQALDRGLVDELGGLDVAIDKAVALLELPEAPADVEIVRLPERKGFLEQLLEEMQGADRDIESRARADAAVRALIDATLPDARPALSAALRLQALGERGDVAALLPGSIEIR